MTRRATSGKRSQAAAIVRRPCSMWSTGAVIRVGQSWAVPSGAWSRMIAGGLLDGQLGAGERMSLGGR